jgi:hypothetical protein
VTAEHAIALALTMSALFFGIGYVLGGADAKVNMLEDQLFERIDKIIAELGGDGLKGGKS